MSWWNSSLGHQFGLFLKGLCDKCSNKSIRWLLGYFERYHFLSKPVASFWDCFLFHHVVTVALLRSSRHYQWKINVRQQTLLPNSVPTFLSQSCLVKRCLAQLFYPKRLIGRNLDNRKLNKVKNLVTFRLKVEGRPLLVLWVRICPLEKKILRYGSR